MKKKWLQKVSEKNEDWLGIAASFVGSKVAHDIVQEMYVSLDRWADERIIKEDGEVNRCYIYLNIRTLCYMYFKEQKKKAELSEDGPDLEYLATINEADAYNEEQDIAWDLLKENINIFIDSWKWYDKTLFNLYKNTPFSLRGLAKETDISWMSIHTTIKKCKDLIREEFKEDYEDFKNGDYHLIKPFTL